MNNILGGYDEPKQALGLFVPDIALCKECEEDVLNSRSPYFEHAFTSCSQCGPRYSRLNASSLKCETTALARPLCSFCKGEYENPNSRRYKAPSMSCPKCGPLLTLLDKGGSKIACTNPIKEAAALLKKGHIVAIKGMGGFHLCCNAKDEAAVQILRGRKNRPHKPFALMVRDLYTAALYVELSKPEQEVLSGKRRPIVLLKKKQPSLLPEAIAPGQAALGLMLPYSPLNLLLLRSGPECLVMTSGNLSGEVISHEDETAVLSLIGIADFFLMHNLEIGMPVDDAVVRVIDGCEMVSRNGRGYAPYCQKINSDSAILGLGAELKASVAVINSNVAVLSQYVGQLTTYEAYKAYKRTLSYLTRLNGIEEAVYAHDQNPDYLSSHFAGECKGRKIKVQHHHAHMAACMFEHALTGSAIGVIFDGTGLGTDGAVWGGEFFVGSQAGVRRAGHLEYVRLQGGDALVKEPWRCAICYLNALGLDGRKVLYGVPRAEIGAVELALTHKLNCFTSSSIGRLFDAAAAIAGIRLNISYEAQAALEFEALADENYSQAYPYAISEEDGQLIFEYGSLLRGVFCDAESGVSKGLISAKFHNAIAEATAQCVIKISKNTGLKTVVLSGGVFENRRLLVALKNRLKAEGLNVYHGMAVPVNDGGVALGQAAVAACILEEEKKNVPCSNCESDRARKTACLG